MRIKGIQKTTLIDFPDLVACTVFTPGCNFHCGFCYNESIVNDDKSIPDVPEEEFFKFLEKRKKVLDGVVVSGGEPTLQKDLPEFLEKIKKMKFKTKLDTNGSNPEMIKELVKKGLVDYFAMDIKAPLEDYEKVCNAKVDVKKIQESIELIKNSGIDYEFRSTVLPALHSIQDFEKIGELLKGSKKFVMQQFASVESVLDKKFQKAERFSKQDFEKFKKILEKYVQSVEVRNLD